MLAALAVVIPLGLGGAVSPVMLTEQTVLLAGPDGRRAGVRYAAGVVLTTFVIVVAIVLCAPPRAGTPSVFRMSLT